MTNDQQLAIEALAAEEFFARMKLENMAMMNTPTDPGERLVAFQATCVARAEWKEINNKLTDAICNPQAIVKESES